MLVVMDGDVGSGLSVAVMMVVVIEDQGSGETGKSNGKKKAVYNSK